jgi:hypothetical protein
MYHTELDPRTMEKVYVPKSAHEKAMQRALIQYRKPQNYNLVYEALTKAGRTDLIGFDKKCLIRPRQMTNVNKPNKATESNKRTLSNKGSGKKISSKAKGRKH